MSEGVAAVACGEWRGGWRAGVTWLRKREWDGCNVVTVFVLPAMIRQERREKKPYLKDSAAK